MTLPTLIPRSSLRVLAAALLTASAATAAAAQDQPRYPLVGVAFDSLHNQPFAMAIVSMNGGRTAFTDAEGRFHFDSLPAGSYHIVVQHDVLDSLGVGALTADASVGPDADTVRVLGPSFTTLWRRACGAGAYVPLDSALLFGTVHNAVTGARVPGASVHVTWVEVGVEGGKLTPYYLGGAVPADANGAYAVCGVPAKDELRVYASVDSSRSGVVDLPAPSMRIERFDVWVPLPADSAARGSVTGVVHDQGGAPFAGANVEVEGAPAVVTDSAGRFTISAVPLGSRQVVVRAVGTQPVVVPVTIGTGGPAAISVTLLHSTTLNEVTVTARSIRRLFASDLEHRREIGLARFVDSASIVRLNSIAGGLTTMPSLRTTNGGIPYWRFNRSGTPCYPSVMIDKRLTDVTELMTYPLTNIGMIEVYEFDNQIPNEISPTMGRRRDNTCGTVVVWSKRMFP